MSSEAGEKDEVLSPCLSLVLRFVDRRQLGLLGWWSVLAAQQPKSSKTDLASLVCLAVLLALPLVVRFGRSAAQILQNGPCQLGLLGCAPCSPLVVRFAQIPQNGPRHVGLLG